MAEEYTGGSHVKHAVKKFVHEQLKLAIQTLLFHQIHKHVVPSNVTEKVLMLMMKVAKQGLIPFRANYAKIFLNCAFNLFVSPSHV